MDTVRRLTLDEILAPPPDPQDDPSDEELAGMTFGDLGDGTYRYEDGSVGPLHQAYDAVLDAPQRAPQLDPVSEQELRRKGLWNDRPSSLHAFLQEGFSAR